MGGESAMLTGREGAMGAEREWARVYVLWRGRAGWRSGGAPDPAGTRRASEEMRDRARMASDSGWSLLGGQSNGTVYLAHVDRAGRAVTVLGRAFAIPERDSALVVMVDRVGGVGGPPILVGTAFVPAELPDRVLPRHWRSGDTLFTLVPAPDRDQRLAAALRRSSFVVAFLE